MYGKHLNQKRNWIQLPLELWPFCTPPLIIFKMGLFYLPHSFIHRSLIWFSLLKAPTEARKKLKRLWESLYIGMCGPKGCFFFPVRNRTSISTILVLNWICFFHSSLGYVFQEYPRRDRRRHFHFNLNLLPLQEGCGTGAHALSSWHTMCSFPSRSYPSLHLKVQFVLYTMSAVGLPSGLVHVPVGGSASLTVLWGQRISD